MERAKVEYFEYIESDKIETQGKRRDVMRRYPNYRIKEERNGYFLLISSVKCNVTLSWNDGMETYNMKEDILELYGRQRMSEALFKKFQKDIENGKYQIWIDDFGYTIKIA